MRYVDALAAKLSNQIQADVAELRTFLRISASQLENEAALTAVPDGDIHGAPGYAWINAQLGSIVRQGMMGASDVRTIALCHIRDTWIDRVQDDGGERDSAAVVRIVATLMRDTADTLVPAVRAAERKRLLDRVYGRSA